MIKVFLVEDEIIIRNGIKNSIDWELHGYDFVGEASDGELALPMILEKKPDILITDIKMPFMDGLELSEHVKKALPDTKIYVNCVLPTTQAAIKIKPVYAKVPEYNKELKALCKKEKVGFIDNTDLVEQSYYASDGVHMSLAYYKKWVNNMAEEAGL